MGEVPRHVLLLGLLLFAPLDLCQARRRLLTDDSLDTADPQPEVFKIRLLHSRSTCISVGLSHFLGKQQCSATEDLFFLTSAEHPNYGGLQIQKLGTRTCLAATWDAVGTADVSKPAVRMQPCDPFMGDQYWVYDVITGELKTSTGSEAGMFCLSASSADGLELCGGSKQDHMFVLGPEVLKVATQQQLAFQD